MGKHISLPLRAEANVLTCHFISFFFFQVMEELHHLKICSLSECVLSLCSYWIAFCVSLCNILIQNEGTWKRGTTEREKKYRKKEREERGRGEGGRERGRGERERDKLTVWPQYCIVLGMHGLYVDACIPCVCFGGYFLCVIHKLYSDLWIMSAWRLNLSVKCPWSRGLHN